MTYEREADQPSVAPQIVTGGGTILVGGLGGLGTWIAGLLAVSGLEAREVLLCDFDRVEEHNLNRQVLYGAEDVGRLKAVSAASRLSKWSPGNTWTPITERISPSFLLENESKLRDIAVTITGFDNAHARMLLGMAAAEAGRLHVDSGGGLLDGNVNLYQPGTDCILCLRSRVNGGVEKAWRLAQDPGAAHCQEDDAASSRLAGAIVTTSAIVASLATVVALGSIANGPQVAHQHFYRARPNDFGSCPGRTGDAGPCLVHRHAIQHEELAGLFRSLLADTSNRLAEF